MQERRLVAIAAVVVLIVIGLLFRHAYVKRQQKLGHLPLAVPGARPTPEPGDASRTTPQRGAASIDGKLHAKKIADRRTEIGLVNTPLRQTENGSRLRVVTRMRRWCGAGDLDAVALDLKNSDSKRMLLSLEPLHPESAPSFPPIARSVAPDQLLNGFDGDYDVPRLSGPTQMGLFICKDSGGTGRCADKPSTDVNQVFTEYTLKGMKNPGYRAPDRVYYFQYMLFEGDGSLSVFNQEAPTASAFAKLGQYVGELPNGGGADKAKSAVETARERTGAIQSLGVETGYSMVELELPIMDRAQCAGGGK